MKFHKLLTGFTLLFLVFFQAYSSYSQCPTLSQTFVLNSADCTPGVTPCEVCPGESITLIGSGINLPQGGCVDFYYGTTNNFNPYQGQGTFMGCFPVPPPTANPCATCPTTLVLFVDACGNEASNEMMALWSGSGFNVNQMSIDFDPANSNGSSENEDIGAGCPWQEPDAAVIASIATICAGATIIGAGPGETVPANVPVIIFTSAGFNYNYNWGSLCPVAPVIYVMQNSCDRTVGAFSNGSSSGPRTTVVSLDCGCSDETTYNTGSLVGGDGAFVTDANFPPLYGNSSCGFPPLPGGGGGGGGPTPVPISFTWNITPDMCNGGPYYAIGIVNPLGAACPQVQTNAVPFNVPCPMPNLTTGETCSNAGLFDLTALADPAVAGVWSGPGVTGVNFDPSGQSGLVELTYTPTNACGIAGTTTVNVLAPPTAQFTQGVVNVCPGGAATLTVSFTGEGPWEFDLLANGTLVDHYILTDNPSNIVVYPTANTNFSIIGLSDTNCTGLGGNTNVGVTAPPSATLTLAGSNSICSGFPSALSIDFSGGTAPYTIVISENGDDLPPLEVMTDPYILTVNPTISTVYTLVSLISFGGCDGTVSGMASINVIPAPTATVPTASVAVCAGQSAIIPVTFTGTGPWTFVPSINGMPQSAINTNSNPYNYSVTATGPGNTVVGIVSVSNAACIGSGNGQYTITIASPPTATLSGGGSICGSGSAPLQVNFTGTGPYTFTYAANGVVQAPIVTFLNPYNFNVSPTVTTVYTLSSLSTTGCTGTTSGQATVSLFSPLTGAVSGGGQVCMGGGGTTVTFTFVGDGPYTFVYAEDGIAAAPITTSNSPYVLSVNPSNGSNYTLVSLVNANCQGTVSGMATVAVFTPPTANLMGTAAFCNSSGPLQLPIDITGTGPFDLVWAIDGVNQPLITTFDDPYYIPVSVNQTTTYTLVSVFSPGCTGVATGSAVLTIHSTPSYSNFDLACNPALGNYTISFDVAGTPPFTVSAGAGSFSGNHFTSSPIPLASTYNFSITDINNCGNLVISGTPNCNCITDAGTVSQAPLSICEGVSVNVPTNGDEDLDANDVLRFVLHTNSGSSLGTILGWFTAPVLSYSTGYAFETNYYFSPIAGNPGTGNTVDVTDPCLSVGQGTLVVFHENPIITLANIPEVCNGDFASVPVSITGGSAPFNLGYTLNGMTQPGFSNLPTGNFTIDFIADGNTLLQVTSASNLYCSASTLGNSITVIANGPPVISNLQTVCNPANNIFTVEFDAVNGDAPFSVFGLTGSFTGTHFTSLPISLSTPDFTISLSDVHNCGSDTRNGLAACNCATDAGSMDQTPLTACVGTPITATFNGGEILDGNDAFHFILHDAPGNPVGTIISSSPTPTFSFDPTTMNVGTPYFISSIAGDNDGTGMVSITDPCLSVANGTMVTWKNPPTATLSGNYDVCPNEVQPLTIFLTGTPPFSIKYSINGVMSPTATTNLFSYTIISTLTADAVFTLNSVSDALCTGTVNGSATINVHQKPVLQNTEYICDLATQTFTVSFDVTNCDTATVQIVGGFVGNYNTTTGHFISAPIPVNTVFNFTVTDFWQCGNAVLTGTHDCQCATDAGSIANGTYEFCAGDPAVVPTATGSFLEPGDTLVYVLSTTQGPPTWTILGTNSIPNFTFNPGLMDAGTPYYIIAVAADTTALGLDFSDPCISYSNGVTVVWKEPVTAMLQNSTEICQGDSTLITIVFGGDGPFTANWTANSQPQSPVVSLGNNLSILVYPSLSANYSLTSVVGDGCAGTVSGGATVSVLLPPDLFQFEKICDFSSQTYTISFKITNGVAPNPVYTFAGLTGTITSDTIFTSDPIPFGTPYDVTISNPAGCTAVESGNGDCQCISNAGSVDPTPITVCTSDLAIAQSNGDFALDPDDLLGYILYQDPALLPAGIIASNAQPTFSFQAGMVAGSTYYISAIVGTEGSTGSIDLTDPCLSISAGVPVVFVTPPAAAITGNEVICPGDMVSFPVSLTGTPPFTLIYAINGLNQPTIPNIPSNTFPVSSNNIQADQVFTLVAISNNICAGTVSGTANVTVNSIPTGSISGDATVCPGIPVELTLDLSGGMHNIVVSGGVAPITLNSVSDGYTFTVTPTTTTVYTISNLTTPNNDCPPMIGAGATVTVVPIATQADISQFGDYNISCGGYTDGSIVLSSTGGTPDYTYLWSTGEMTETLMDAGAGSYSVTVTDSKGCTAEANYSLTQPEALLFDFQSAAPICYGQTAGSISIDTIYGGVGPYTVNLAGNNVPITNFPLIVPDLNSGDYTIEVVDANGCGVQYDATIDTPEEIKVNAGIDIDMIFGDTAQMQAFTNAATIESAGWSPPTFLSSPDSSFTLAYPEISGDYEYIVVDTNGCEGRDLIHINVTRLNRIYIPNAIIGKSNLANEYFTVFGGPEVRNIKLMQIYDRWGECIFSKENLQPNDYINGWDGYWKDRLVPPGVYVYWIEVEMIDGTTQKFKGDLTVAR